MTDKLDFPATGRNRDAILNVLSEALPDTGTVLEVSSGSGQHVVHFASALPHLSWQPTDIEDAHLASINAWRDEAGVGNVSNALHLDVTSKEWPVARADVILNCNMIHIAPWECCLGLLDGAERVLSEGGILFLYGPFKIGGKHTSDSNEQFDASLRARDPSWGVRNLDDVALEARRRGLHLIKTVKMPANNFSVIFRKTMMVAG